MIKEKKNYHIFIRGKFLFGFLSMDWKIHFFPVQLIAKFSSARCYLYKAMI